MKWALFSEDDTLITEFSSWVPRAVAHYWGSTNVTRDEPQGRVDYNGQRLVPLADEVPAMEPWERVSGRSITDNGDTATAVYTITDKDLADYRAEREAWVADHRWQIEEGGIVWQRGDGKVYGIATDAKSQAKLDAERAAALSGLRAAGDPWKCLDVATGQAVFLAVTDAEIIEISETVRAHVVGLFKREGDFVADVRSAETVQDVAAVEF